MDFQDRNYNMKRYIGAVKASKNHTDPYARDFYAIMANDEVKNFSEEELAFIKLRYL